jgi:hypothetical protein
MGIDFVEVEEKRAVVELFRADTKARPLHLEGEVIPRLIAKVGDEKLGRLTMEQVIRLLPKLARLLALSLSFPTALPPSPRLLYPV